MEKEWPPCHTNWMESDGEMGGMIDTTTIEITPEILVMVAEIEEFKGAWQAIGRISPERLSALRRVATIESAGSSTRIEGATLDNRAVERLLSNLDLRTFTSRDEQEVAGYAVVMETVFESAGAIVLAENHILQLHRDLLRFSDKDARHRGAYKTLPNHVEAVGPEGETLGVVFETATPFDTPRLVHELVGWTRGQLREGALHALIVIAIFIVVFLKIHPFQDGNGRLSRILTTLLLLRAGYEYVPYGSLESVVEASKEAYYLALRRTQQTIGTNEPDWTPWLLFFLKAFATAQDASRAQARAGASFPRCAARAFGAVAGVLPGARPADGRHCPRVDRRQPQHGERSLEALDEGRSPRPTRSGARHLVCLGVDRLAPVATQPYGRQSPSANEPGRFEARRRIDDFGQDEREPGATSASSPARATPRTTWPGAYASSPPTPTTSSVLAREPSPRG